MWIVWICAQLV